MGLEETRLVRWMQTRLNGRRLNGDDDALLASAVAELQGRLRRLHRLGEGYGEVCVSRHIAGLRAVSVPDRVGGVSSPGTA